MTKAEAHIPWQICKRCGNARDRRCSIPVDRGEIRQSTGPTRGSYEFLCDRCRDTTPCGRRTGEQRIHHALRALAIPYKSQYPVNNYRFDFAFPTKRLLVEVQSARAHGHKFQKIRDSKKRQSAMLLGWKILYVQANRLSVRQVLQFLAKHEALPWQKA